MDNLECKKYTAILRAELVPALGCTEPIAIAFAAATAAKYLGEEPHMLQAICSGNIIKNVQGVVVPNSDGMRGIAAAAILGAVGGNPDKKLEVLEGVTPEKIAKAKQLLRQGICECSLAENVPNLYIEIIARGIQGNVRVIVEQKHTQITLIEKNGAVVYQNAGTHSSAAVNKEILSLEKILDYARSVEISEIEPILSKQAELNLVIAQEGLRSTYGINVGKSLLDKRSDTWTKARAYASAGSDARMSGCPLPVVINSGSGNQGMTVSLPVIIYAEELGASKELLYRALAISNLTALLQKRYIGDLSAFCGAVSAAAGAASGIVYLYGGNYKDISNAITNTIASVGGMICDGAKASCAYKIAVALEAALMGVQIGLHEHKAFQCGEGIVKSDIEKTIASVGSVGCNGMKQTDIEILRIMLQTNV